LGSSEEVDKTQVHNLFRKGLRTRFQLITADTLAEQFKKKDSEFFEEIKKCDKTKELPHELLIKMLIAKLEEERKSVIEQKAKVAWAAKKAQKKKIPRRKEDEKQLLEPQLSGSDLSLSLNIERDTKTPPTKKTKPRIDRSRMQIIGSFPLVMC
jgi:hypothetical protein